MGNIAGVPQVEIDKTLTDEKVAELSTISGFTPEQVREYHTNFWEDNPTGLISKKRFMEVYKKFFSSGKPDNYCEHVFRAYDPDNSGDIDFAKYLIAVSMTVEEQDPKKKLESAFLIYDIDHNGFIEKKEMKKILEGIFELRGKEITDSSSLSSKVNEIFVKMDKDGDGKLSKEEFITGCSEDDNLRKLLVP